MNHHESKAVKNFSDKAAVEEVLRVFCQVGNKQWGKSCEKQIK